MVERKFPAVGFDVVNPLFLKHKAYHRAVDAEGQLRGEVHRELRAVDVDPIEDFGLEVRLVDGLILYAGVFAVGVGHFCLNHQVGCGEFGVADDGGAERGVAGLIEITARVVHVIAHRKVRRTRNLLTVSELHIDFAKLSAERSRGEQFVINLGCVLVVLAVVVKIEGYMLVTQTRREVVFARESAPELRESCDAFLLRKALDGRNVKFCAALGLVGALGDGGFAAKVDVSAQKLVSKDNFLRRQFAYDVVGVGEFAVFVVLADFGCNGFCLRGVVNKIRIEIYRKTAHFAVVIEVERILVVVVFAVGAEIFKVVVNLVVAPNVRHVLVVVFVIELALVIVPCADEVVVVDLVVDAEVHGQEIVGAVIVNHVGVFPFVV